MLNIDKIDKKLLQNLDFDVRVPVSSLAKAVNLSKQGVDYRIKRLQKNGVILGYYPVINTHKLGYHYCRFFIKLQNITREKENEILKAIKDDTRFKWLLRGEGNYDILCASYLKTLSDFKKLSEEIFTKWGNNISLKRESTGIRIHNLPSRHIWRSHDDRAVAVGETEEVIRIDETDKKILTGLSQNARIPLIELAKKLSMSSSAILYRLHRLEKNGIVLAYRPIINHAALGFLHYKVLFYLAEGTEEELKKFKEYLKTNLAVIYMVEEIGICDIDVELMVESSHDFYEFIRELKFTFPQMIKSYDSFIITETIKINYLPFD